VAAWEIGVAGAVSLLFAIVQFATAETSGGFWWFDSASHALNGVFLHDLVASGGWRDPIAYSVGYFARYPGLTLGFYPPGLAVIMAPFYAVLGVGHAAAQLCLSVASAGLALGVFMLARETGLRTAPALAAALLALGVPEMLLWGRQIQPEIPAYACATWSAWLLLRWLGAGRPGQLYLAVLLFVGGLYVKQTICFLAPAFLLVLWCELGWSALRRRGIWLAAAVALLSALPLAALTLVAGGFNLVQATASAPSGGGWQDATFYLTALPGQLGWLPLVLAALGLCALAMPHSPLSRAGRTLLLAWTILGLAFFTAIALKSPRFSTAILPALAIVAVVPFDLPSRFRPSRFRPWRDAAALATAVAAVAFGLATTPTLSFLGPRAAAEFVAATAPAGSNVLLLAHRSANFIFALRCYTERGDIRVVRAEKLYTDYRISKEFGISTSATLDEHAMLDGMRTRNIAMVVVERGFWDDVPAIRQLHGLLAGQPFERLQSIALSDQAHPGTVGFFDIYRREDYRREREPDVVISLPLLGRNYKLPAEAM
jgi:4-amino-4-deoxy-L-arabinose transferase-like glycosyltransferase